MIDPDSYPYLDPSKDRRVALITGGNSGVGYYTVLHLYLHGYIIYIAGRSKSRVTKLIIELNETATLIRLEYLEQDLKTRFLGELHFLEIDLIKLISVQQAVSQFRLLEDKLHILINNAGVMGLAYELTEDKFEIKLQTNYISPFLLTTSLLPLLDKAFTIETPPRIIHLSSLGHKFAPKYFSMDSKLNFRPNFIFTWLRYAKAKIAGIHFMKMLALRNPQILSMSVHPGLVMNTNLFTYWTRLPIIGIVFWILFQIFGYFFGITPEQGANAVIKCCLDPNLTLEACNGKYFAKGELSEPTKVANDMDYAARTWIWTVRELALRGFTIP